jgi:dihydrofolate synthase/folylpolyglutamate synthase
MYHDFDSPEYLDAVQYLYGRIDYERRTPPPYETRFFKLDRMRSLLRQLGNPQNQLPTVHIAGSKGKGSVAAFLATALGAAGDRTGLYTSPHLNHLEERLVIDGQLCPRAELVDLVAQVRKTVDPLDASEKSWIQRYTFFELVTAIAFLHFAKHQVDSCVLETGLGGRLDSTTACQPAVTVISSISRDHTQQLGNSLTAIALEKAGIIKPEIPIVTGVTDPEALGQIEQVAKQSKAMIWRLGREFFVDEVVSNRDGTQCVYRDADGRVPLQIELVGRHQATNAAVAMAALRVWGKTTRPELSQPDLLPRLQNGFKETTCPARVEILSTDPPVVVDAAHNVASTGALSQTLASCFAGHSWSVVFGTSGDKEHTEMLRQILSWADRLILTQYRDNPRAADPKQLYDLAVHKLGASPDRVEVIQLPVEAWESCLATWSPSNGICVTGSFFLAAELRSIMLASLAASNTLLGWTASHPS